MAKIIMVCYKNEYQRSRIIKKIGLLSGKLIPDLIKPKQTKIINKGKIIFGIFNPNDYCMVKEDRSVYLGVLFGNFNWWEPNDDYPDGSYALFRSNEEYIEIVSDVVASRTIWYYKDNDIFIASTSQRAIINIIDSFDFNEKVIPWVLSTGSLGPEYSWDKRIRHLNGDSSVILNRSKWSLAYKENKCEFLPLEVEDDKHLYLMKDSLVQTFDSLKIDYSKWALALSGGYDSRYILSVLKNKKGLKTVTWGSKSSRSQKGNDSYIAKLLAEIYGIPNRYFILDREVEIDKILDYFTICGEGRIDHLSGYTDGFEMWKTLFKDNVQGIIRGDVGFSTKKISSITDMRFKLELPLCLDFSNLSCYEDFGFAKQELPDNLKLKKGETIETWRDRLYQQVRIPTVLAALSDLKLPFLEIINPLLSRQIIYCTRRLPDHLRTNKILFKEIVKASDISGLQYAKFDANENRKDILKTKLTVEFLKAWFESNYKSLIIPEEFLKYILSNIIVNEKIENNSVKNMIKTFLPTWLKNKLRKNITEIKKPVLNFNIIAFRTYILCKMHKLLMEDIKSGNK